MRDVITDPSDATLTRTIVTLAREFGLAVIAAGVETDEQRQFLEDNGCHDHQGYLLGAPCRTRSSSRSSRRSVPVRSEVGDALWAPPTHVARVNAGKAFATIASDAVRQIRK